MKFDHERYRRRIVSDGVREGVEGSLALEGRERLLYRMREGGKVGQREGGRKMVELGVSQKDAVEGRI